MPFPNAWNKSALRWWILCKGSFHHDGHKAQLKGGIRRPTLELRSVYFRLPGSFRGLSFPFDLFSLEALCEKRGPTHVLYPRTGRKNRELSSASDAIAHFQRSLRFDPLSSKSSRQNRLGSHRWYFRSRFLALLSRVDHDERRSSVIGERSKRWQQLKRWQYLRICCLSFFLENERNFPIFVKANRTIRGRRALGGAEFRIWDCTQVFPLVRSNEFRKYDLSSCSKLRRVYPVNLQNDRSLQKEKFHT